MEELSVVGEEVLYTGDTSHAFDGVTLCLMVQRLFIGKYTIIEVGNYGAKGKYYVFREVAGAYPCKSFVKHTRDFYKAKYNLR